MVSTDELRAERLFSVKSYVCVITGMQLPRAFYFLTQTNLGFLRCLRNSENLNIPELENLSWLGSADSENLQVEAPESG
jgi:hypothetical protein